MNEPSEALVAELARLNRQRQIAVGVAIALLVLSFAAPSLAFAVLRSLAWGVAGLLSFLHASKAKQAGMAASYTNAVIYLVVAVLPLLKGR